MLKKIRRLLGATSSIEDQLNDIEGQLSDFGGVIDTPEEMQELLLLHNKIVALKPKCEDSQQIAHADRLLAQAQRLSDNEQMFPSQERVQQHKVDDSASSPSDQVNEIFDALKERVDDRVREWENDPDEEFSIPSITGRWAKKNILELFSEGGPLPRTVMGLRVRAEGAKIRSALGNIIERYRSARLSDCAEVGAEAVEYAKQDRTKILAELEKQIKAGNSHLESFEETYRTYFRYVNLTQVVNQYFYGVIFFGGLEKLKDIVVSRLIKMSPWIRAPMLKAAAKKSERKFLEAVMAGNGRNAYNYALDAATARAFTPSEIFETKLMPPGGRFVPELDYESILKRGLPYAKHDWARLKQIMVTGTKEYPARFMSQERWMKEVWPYLFAKYRPSLATKLEGMWGQLPLGFKSSPPKVSEKVPGKLTHIPDKFADAIMKDNPFDDFPNLGIVAKLPSSSDLKNLGVAFLSGTGTAARNLAVSKVLEPAENAIYASSEIDRTEAAIERYLSQRIDARSDEIFNDTVKTDWDDTLKQMTDDAESDKVVTVQDVADALTRVLDSHSGQIAEKIEQIVHEEMSSDDWKEEALGDDLSVDEELGKEWYQRCLGIYYGIYLATDVTHARALLDELTGMRGTAPMSAAGGFDLNNSLEGLISNAKAFVESLGGGE